MFRYTKHSPDDRVAKGSRKTVTFEQFADQWLETLTTEHGTKMNYRSSLTRVWLPEIGNRRLADVRHTDIKAVIARRRKLVSGKTINNDLIPLRAVFEAAVADGKLGSDPSRLVRNLKHQSPTPDPFTSVEVNMILEHLREHAPIQVWAYYVTAFQTGLRPSEQIIAKWSKVDWIEGTLRIDTALTRGKIKGTKTGTIRDVNLSPGVINALVAMKPITLLKGPESPIFCHPATGRPWTNDQYQRVTFFHPTLEKLGIRKRDAYQTRHTYATTALMAGVTPAYISRQMGHTNASMLFRHYGKWIDGADRGRQRAKLEEALAYACQEDGRLGST